MCEFHGSGAGGRWEGFGGLEMAFTHPTQILSGAGMLLR